MKLNVLQKSIAFAITSALFSPALLAADVSNLKATDTNVAFSDIKIEEYTTQGKPNIILLTMDDLGYGQMDFDQRSFDKKYLQQRHAVDTYKISIDKAIEAAQKSTPTLNHLIDQGVKINNGYVAHGVCGPSRAAMMTGKSPARFGIYSNTDAQDGVPVDQLYLPELLQHHGYYTAAIGKWHASKISNVPVAKDKQTRDYHDNFTTYSGEPWQPQNRGFDYFMGYHASGVAYYNSPSLFRNRQHVAAKGYITDQFTDEAIKVVNRAKATNQPFMINLAYNAPHLPNDAPAPHQYQDKFDTGSQTADNFYASVYAVDQSVKRLLEQLKKNGQYDNTIIMFTSDNGAVIDGPLPLNGDQQGNKGQTVTGGTHTPMFIWWNGKLQKTNGKELNQLVSAMDFMPTALDAAGIDVPQDIDGKSLLPILEGKSDKNVHDALYWITSYAHHWDEENIAFWDGYHKYVRNESDDYPFNPNTEDLSQFSWTVRTNQYALTYIYENNSFGLYKLDDLAQQHNLADSHPEVIKQLKSQILTFAKQSRRPNNAINDEKYDNLIATLTSNTSSQS